MIAYKFRSSTQIPFALDIIFERRLLVAAGGLEPATTSGKRGRDNSFQAENLGREQNH
jgi:hypothetical protein